jgi:hypothetical protein
MFKISREGEIKYRKLFRNKFKAINTGPSWKII